MKNLALVLTMVSTLAFASGGGGGGGGEGGGNYVKMEPLTINLKTNSYIQFTPQIKVRDQKDQDVVKTYMPVIRFEMIKSMIGREAEKVQTPAFMESFAEEVTELINGVLSGGIVKGVFFESWIVQ